MSATSSYSIKTLFSLSPETLWVEKKEKGENSIGGNNSEKKIFLRRGKKDPASPSPLRGVETSALSQQFERKQKIAKWYKI